MITLYKRDSHNRIRIINFWCEGNLFHTEAGLLDGKLIKNTTICTPKNVIKTNATTAEEQSILEMESKIREKLQEDYFRTKEEAKNNIVILPMLAKSYEDEKHKIDWNDCYCQIKFDGQRVLTLKENGKVKLISRDGVQITTLNHIVEELEKDCYPDNTYDGEAFNLELGGFQNQMKAIKKYTKGLTEKINYNIYDIVSDKPFKERFVDSEIKFNGCLKKVETNKILNEIELLNYHSKNISNGEEGTMIRFGKEGYKINGRSSNLLKFKDFKDLDAKIIDIIPAENRPEWGIVVCEYNGKQFKATPKMSQEDKIDLLKSKIEYIDKTCIVTYFEFTDDKLPRFPIYKGIRLDLNK